MADFRDGGIDNQGKHDRDNSQDGGRGHRRDERGEILGASENTTQTRETAPVPRRKERSMTLAEGFGYAEREQTYDPSTQVKSTHTFQGPVEGFRGVPLIDHWLNTQEINPESDELIVTIRKVSKRKLPELTQPAAKRIANGSVESYVEYSHQNEENTATKKRATGGEMAEVVSEAVREATSEAMCDMAETVSDSVSDAVRQVISTMELGPTVQNTSPHT